MKCKGTVKAACSIWWTPVRLQATRELERDREKKRERFDSAQSSNIWAIFAPLTLSVPTVSIALSMAAMWGS